MPETKEKMVNGIDTLLPREIFRWSWPKTAAASSSWRPTGQPAQSRIEPDEDTGKGLTKQKLIFCMISIF